MNAANLHVLSNVADAPQAILEPVSQVRRPETALWGEQVLSFCSDSESVDTQEQLSASNSLADMADITDPPTSPLGATDSTDDSDEVEDDDSDLDDWDLQQPPTFDPHSLCE